MQKKKRTKALATVNDTKNIIIKILIGSGVGVIAFFVLTAVAAFILLKEKVVKECMVVGSESDKEDTVVKARIFPDVSAISAETGNINVSHEEIEKAVKKAVRNVNSQVVGYKAIKETEIMEKEFAKTTTAKIKRNQ